MLHRYLKKYGVIKVTLAISLASILLSNLMMSAFDQVSQIGNIKFPPFMIPTVIPAIVAPLIIYMILRLVVQVNLAEEKLRTLSITDELTGAYNRRHFIDLARQVHARAQRYDEIFSIAILDIDDFKGINDTYGHLVGDQALIQVARICRENIRLPDIFARYGGDEFVFLFSATGKEKAHTCLERILEDISNNPIQHDGRKMRIQVCIGLAEYSNKEFLIDDLLREADMALYQAKHTGKNKVVPSITTG
jgi:diguanylate cyclase (GGDEF)-like protein